jgi:hypothetical protein
LISFGMTTIMEKCIIKNGIAGPRCAVHHIFLP